MPQRNQKPAIEKGLLNVEQIRILLQEVFVKNAEIWSAQNASSIKRITFELFQLESKLKKKLNAENRNKETPKQEEVTGVMDSI